MSRSRTDHRARAIAHHRQGPWIQAAHMLVIAGCNRRDCCVEIIDNGTLQVLRLKSFASPAAGCRTVETECVADAIISAGTSEECINLLDRRLCPTKTGLKN